MNSTNNAVLPSTWFVGLGRRPAAAVRLFCFPYAGGGTDIYLPWMDYAPDFLEVCPIQLPGRGARMSEAPLGDFASMVQSIVLPLRSCLDKPFALVGHSMGGFLAFQVARALRHIGSASGPLHLFVSGCPAPIQPPRNAKWAGLSDEDLLHKVLQLNRSRSEVRDNPELVELMLPGLRADLKILEDYKYEPEAPLPCGITAFVGQQDPEVCATDLKQWQLETVGELRVFEFPGDHFFISAQGPAILAEIASTLASSSPVGRVRSDSRASL